MGNKKQRTYNLEADVVDFIDNKTEETNMDKSELVNRAVKVYAAKLASGDWKDPKYQDDIDKMFNRIS